MQRFTEGRVGTDELLKLRRIGTIDRKRTEPGGLAKMAVNGQVARDARLLRQLRQRGGLVHAIFSHVPIRGPLAASDREQAALIDVNGVIAGE